MRSWYNNLDYVTLLTWVALVAAGLTAIYSTTHGPASEYLLESVRQNFERQLMWFVICATGVGIALMLPVRFYQKIAYPAYVFCLGLLVAALLFGREINGAKAWLAVGPVQLQVSELAKVGTVLAVAQLLSSRRPGDSTVKYGLMAVGLLIVPAGLILLQNDAGTALVFFGLVPIMLFWSGLPLNTVLLLISPAIVGYFAIVYMPVAIALSVALTLGLYLRTKDLRLTALAGIFTGGTVLVASVALTRVLQPHQLARIVSFTNPEAEEYRSGVGYHLVQSKAAIGSGGVTGKGFMEGTQTQGAYIPEQSTDFIFSVIGEEWGFLGTVLLLALFALLLTRLIVLGTQVKHPFGSMVAAGAVGVYLIHVFINVGMVTGLLPVIGIPLPFVSYGGSALLANSAMLGIVLNLHMRRDDFSIYGY
ncbi:MAG: rod shape-determining protein RodA [Bacteroidetes bacterium]|jgi:rod shape determining protein RodA|nr:rod shape-determining protein RodA [Bacteroidota bacterium]